MVGYPLHAERKRWEGREWANLLLGKQYRDAKRRAGQIFVDTMKLIEESSKVGGMDDIKRKAFDLEASEKAIKEILAARAFSKLNLLPLAWPESYAC